MLAWDTPLLHQQNGVIIGYTITQRVAGNVTTLTSRDSMLLVDGLRPFTSYSFEVAASTGVGLGPATAPLPVQTQQAGKYIGSHEYLHVQDLACMQYAHHYSTENKLAIINYVV